MIKTNTPSKLKLLFVLLSLLLVTTSCNLFGNDNDQEQLPPQTQTGEGTFGCLINGEPFVVSNTSKQVAIYQGGVLQFGGGGIFMILENPLEIDKHYDLKRKVRYRINPNPQLGCHYEFENSYEGFVRFTKIDRVNYIISGTFQFSVNTSSCEDLKISQGIFDMKYIP